MSRRDDEDGLELNDKTVAALDLNLSQDFLKERVLRFLAVENVPVHIMRDQAKLAAQIGIQTNKMGLDEAQAKETDDPRQLEAEIEELLVDKDIFVNLAKGDSIPIAALTNFLVKR